MTDQELSRIISGLVDSTISANKETFTEALCDGLTNDASSTGEVMARMSLNTVKLSSVLSVQIILRTLEEAGFIELKSDDGPELRVIAGGKHLTNAPQ